MMDSRNEQCQKKNLRKEGKTISEKYLGNNKVCLEGEIASGFQYSHEVFGERFYRTNLFVNRDSGTVDSIPIAISERLADEDMEKVYLRDYTGCTVKVAGQFRSYNRTEENDSSSQSDSQREERKPHLELSVFVKEFCFLGKECGGLESNNQIFLRGFLCKPPVYRRTPKGRKIADILLAVHRVYGRSDYIPCIAWRKDARLASGLKVGSAIEISGRIQSREYVKVLSETESETRVAYEVSVREMETGTEIRESRL